MVEQLHIGLLAPKLTPAAVRPLLTAMAAEPLLAPTHGSPDERKRIPYESESIVGAAERGPVELWRTQEPRYAGSLITNRDARNMLKLSFESPADNLLPAIFEGATRLANQIRPEFGFVHALWQRGPASEAYNFGYRLQARDLDKCGLGNVYARTWFGPYLVERIGKPLLLSLPQAYEMLWGGIQTDLVLEPWLADFDVLSAAQAQVMKQLRSTGLVGDFTGPPVRWKPGARWVSPGWQPNRQH